MHHQVIAETINRVVTLLLIIISVYLNLGLIYVLLATVAGSALQILIAYLWADKLITIKFKFNFKLWRTLLFKAIPLGISVILIFIYYKIDIIILSVLKPSTDVGIYGASYKVLDIVSTFPGMFCGLLLPIFANVYSQNKMQRFNKLIQKGFDVLAITGIPITIILFCLAKPTILLIAGNEFTASIFVLKILAPSAILISLNWIFWITLVGGDKQNSLIIPYFFISLFNIILNLILIPHYSYIGAAVATVATQLVSLIIPWWLTRKFFRTKISLTIFAKALVSGIIMFFVFYFIQRYNLIID
jgi:O-antigen/teichoic acid export membrane protein